MFSLPEVLPEWVSVNQAADFLGVSPRRVRAMASQGRLRAYAESPQQSMCISRDDLIARKSCPPRAVKPLNSRSFNLVKDAVAQQRGDAVSPLWREVDSSSRVRARERAIRLRRDPHPASLIRAWSLHEPKPQIWWVEQSNVGELEMYATGFSHPAAHLTASSQFEARVKQIPQCLQRDSEKILHPIEVVLHHERESREGVRVVDALFDLALHARAREDDAVACLVRE